MLYKSNNMKNVPDEFFDTVDKIIESVANDTKDLLPQLACQVCGKHELTYSVMSVGTTVCFGGVHCESCGTKLGTTGFRVFDYQTKKEIHGVRWLLNYLGSFL